MPERNRYRAVSARLDPALTASGDASAALALDRGDREGCPNGSHADDDNHDDDFDHVAGLGLEALPRMSCSYPCEGDSCRDHLIFVRSGCQPVAAVRRLRTSQ